MTSSIYQLLKPLFVLHLMFTYAFTQFSVDGEFSEPEYQLLASKLNNNSGFGPDVDVSSIYYATDGDNLYLGFECKVQNVPNGYNPKPDGVGVFLNFSSEIGSPAGTPLGFYTYYDYHFLNGGIETGWQNNYFKADFEVDYLFAIYSDGSPNTILLDAASNVSTNSDSVQTIAITDQLGTPVSGPYFDGVFSTNTIVFAYQQSTGSGSRRGAEIKIPFTEVNAAVYDQFQLFAVITGSIAFFSNVTIPGNVTNGNSGGNPDYNINLNSVDCGCPLPESPIGFGPYHTNLVPLGESRPVIRTTPMNTLDFGEGYIGYLDTLLMNVQNVGAEQLTVTEIQLSGEAFAIEQDTFSLVSGASQQIAVVFEPTAIQEYLGNLAISSNDTANPIVSITLVGSGLLPPEVFVDPDSMNISLLPGAAVTLSLHLDNTPGLGELNWRACVTNGDMMSTLTFTKNNYADWTLPENQDRITDNVWITRANSQGIFNFSTEPEYDYYQSPDDTEWSYGYSADLNPEDYAVWREAIYADPLGMINEPIAVHLISDDIYLDFVFHSWTSGGDGGGFSYTRTFPTPSWISLVQDSGNVAAGSSSDVDVLFDATGLEAGDHYANIVISSNDPDQPEIVVPIHLEVIGASDFYTATDTLDFGNVFINYPGTLTLIVENLGSEILLITDALVEPLEYQVEPSIAQIAPGEGVEFEIHLSPTTTGSYLGTLTFTTNDPDESSILITLMGEAFAPPVVNVFPDSLAEELFIEESSIQNLTISNTGLSELVFEIKAHAMNTMNPERNLHAPVLSNSPRYSWNEIKDITSLLAGKVTSRPQTSHSSKAGLQPGFQANREVRESWELLYTDPDEQELFIDIQNVYGNITSDELLFKLTSYQAWSDPQGNGVAVIYIDADQDINTGINTEDDGMGWFLGIDFAIMRTGFDGDGLFIWDESEGNLTWIDDLTTSIAEENSNEIIVGVNLAHFQEYTGISFAMMAGSYMVDEPDIVPDFQMGHIEYLFSPSWLIFDPENGSIEPGSSQEISVTFDATGMYGGEYFADIQVISNDPATPMVSIPAYFDVTGLPDIDLEIASLEFGILFVDYETRIDFEIFNVGTDSLIISSITSDNPAFNVSPASVELNYSESALIHVNISPSDAVEYSGMITIVSNDPDEAAIAIPVHATALIPPVIAVDATTVIFDMSTGLDLRDTLRISNTGGSDLTYNVHLQYQGMLRDAGGPDAFGYFWKDSDDPGGPQFEWIHDPDGIYLPLEDDGYFSGIPLGFNFDYYGDTFNTINFMYNGWLSFTSADSWYPSEIPAYGDSWSYNGAIAPFAGDLYPEYSPSYSTQGEAPNRTFIFEYYSSWCCGGPPFMSFEVIFYESTNRIRFQYQDLDGQTPVAIGIANSDNSTGLGNGGMDETYIDPSLVRDNYAIEFAQQIEWLSVQPSTGNVGVGRIGELELIVNAEGLEAGDHGAEIVISSNDPATPETIIPAILHVEPVGLEEEELLPDSYILSQNYPNPFNPSTHIAYGLPQLSDVHIVVYDILGRVRQEWNYPAQAQGWYDLEWNGTDLMGRQIGAGVYFAHLRAGGFNKTIKMLYMK